MSTGHGVRYGILIAAVIAATALTARCLCAAEPVGADAPGAVPRGPDAPQKCLEAVVSPVTGFAECVNPRGAPVEQPPPRPDNRCMQRVPASQPDRKPCSGEAVRAPATDN